MTELHTHRASEALLGRHKVDVFEAESRRCPGRVSRPPVAPGNSERTQSQCDQIVNHFTHGARC